MRRVLAAVLAFAAATVCAGEAPAIVPNPASYQAREGAFAFSASTPLRVEGDARARRVALDFAERVSRSNGYALKVRQGAALGREGAVTFLVDASGGFAPEAYRIDVTPRRVMVSAGTPAGLFHGATTLWQMIAPGAGTTREIPAAIVDDAPRFPWRGIMLDSARHYQPPEFILRFIDAMALHKLNVLHWHLTDDQAWRLEIRKYPRLTSVGAWRVPAGAAARADIDPATGKPRLYGGFYSRQDVRRIVAYAAARGITIVPEIEMPGHASAAVAAYPELAAAANPSRDVPADWGVYANVYSLEDSTFRFLEGVLTEVMELFPGRYIHMGGDEVVKSQWQDSARGQALMRELGTSDPARLQLHFTQRIARFLESRGRRAVGWDEILEPGMPQSAVVMSWRGVDGALKAANAGYDTVLAAHPTLYFDNRQDAAASEPPGRATVISLADVYRFEPMPAAISPERRRHVLGVQANVWTEHIRTAERVGWMTFPRAAAVAELGWSQPERRDFADFTRRLAAMPARYEALGMTYAKSAFAAARSTAAAPSRLMSQDLRLCSQAIALNLEDDAPVAGPRAKFLVDIQNPCWIVPGVDLASTRTMVASVGQVPFNFQIGEDVHKIVFPAPTTPEGELLVHADTCDGRIVARLPLAPAAASQAVTTLPRAQLSGAEGRHDLCLRFAQPRLEPMWVIDSIEMAQ